jgi:putative Ig domain-containing protein
VTAYNLLATIQSTAPSGQPVNFRYPNRTGGQIVGTAVSMRPLISGGTAPFAFSVLSGALPTGLSLATDGLISGTLTAIGDYIAIIQVQDNLGVQFPSSFSFSVSSGYHPERYTPTPGARGTAYSYQLIYADAANNTTGFTFSVIAGSMPSGLSLSSAGLISGTPGIGSIGTTYVTVRGAKSGINLDVEIKIRIVAPMTLGVTLPSGIANQSLAGTITVTNGIEPFRTEVTSNALPAGVSLSNSHKSKIKITGTPTAFTPSTGWSNPVVTVTDAIGQVATIAVPFQVNQGVRAAPRGSFIVTDSDGSPTDASFLNVFLADGSDGDFVCNGSNTLPGTSLSGGINRALGDLYLNSLTSVAGGTLNMDGYDLYILTNWDTSAAPAGAVICKGGNASLLTAGARARFGTAGGAGTAGVTGVSSAGQSANSIDTSAGGFGGGFNGGGVLVGKGGAGSSGASGNGGAGGAITNSITEPSPIFAPLLYFFPSAAGTCSMDAIQAGTGGGGGSAGSGNGVAAGGNSGAGGGGAGRGKICVKNIITSVSTPAGVIDFSGGDGSPGVNGGGTGRGGGGGGSGGGGGVPRLYYGFITGPAVADFIYADGGDGANGGNAGGGAGTAGVGGKGGKGGLVQVTNLLTGVTTIATASQPTDPTTQTASLGTTCRGSI